MYASRCLALLYAHPEAHRGCQSSPPYPLSCPTPSPSCHNPSCFVSSRAHLPGSVFSNSPTRPFCVLTALDTVTSLQWLWQGYCNFANNMHRGFCTLVLFISLIILSSFSFSSCFLLSSSSLLCPFSAKYCTLSINFPYSLFLSHNFLQ